MKVIKIENVFKGKLLQVFRKYVENSDGSTWLRETVSYGGNASVVLGEFRNSIVLVSQFRPTSEKIMLELPAGRIEKGETADECAKREYEEEVGLIPKKLIKLFEFYPSPGFVEEKMYMFYTNEFEEGKTNLDKGEELRISFLPVEEVDGYLFSNRIIDAKTIIGLLAWKVMKNERNY